METGFPVKRINETDNFIIPNQIIIKNKLLTKLNEEEKKTFYSKFASIYRYRQ